LVKIIKRPTKTAKLTLMLLRTKDPNCVNIMHILIKQQVRDYFMFIYRL